VLFYVFFFFFSSRRRHTRWPRDWSSEVCSSDLRVDLGEALPPTGVVLGRPAELASGLGVGGAAGFGAHQDRGLPGDQPCEPDRRSEERRVGKECRSRGWADE